MIDNIGPVIAQFCDPSLNDAVAVSEGRDLLVWDDILDDFLGWLEFAGRDLPGVARCPEWPRRFIIERVKHFATDFSGEPMGLTLFRVVSDEWPDAGTMQACSRYPWIHPAPWLVWHPTFYSVWAA